MSNKLTTNTIIFSPFGGPARLRQSGGDAEGRGGRNKSVTQSLPVRSGGL